MTAQRLQVEVVSWQWLLIPTSGSAHTGFIKLPLPNNVSDVSCSTRVQERNSQSISTLPLRSSLSQPQEKGQELCWPTAKKKILKVKSNLFLFNLQATSNGNCIHAPSIQDGTRPPLTRCPFFMKITFLHNSTGEGRKSNRAKAKRKSMKGNFSTSFRQSGIFYDATWAPSACCCCCCIDH